MLLLLTVGDVVDVGDVGDVDVDDDMLALLR